ncbi:MAG: DNA polymerase Y family protein [Alphaproteobacteria bacterium]|nr:DNA polymerase Y family protein [Alphaproteobacteria bacterium]
MPPAGRRLLSLWLPTLATDRLGAVTRPRVSVAAAHGSLTVIAVNRPAGALGLTPGMGLADARAMLPTLDAVDADPAGEAATLAALADWCGRYTPIVALDGADGLLLDITGAGHLFGGECRLIDDMTQHLARLGYGSRAAIAHTPAAAWALVHYAGEANAIAPSGNEAVALLARLPVAALRLAPEVVLGLRDLGLHRIGALFDLPRAPLAARFGALTVQRLDALLGRHVEPVVPHHGTPTHRIRLTFPEPISRAEDIAAAARRLLEALAVRLAKEQLGVRRLDYALYRTDGQVAHARIGTVQPVREPRHLLRLLAEPLAAIDPGLGIETGIMAALETMPLAPRQLAMDHASPDGAPGAADDGDLGLLLDRLGQRLGSRNVWRQTARASHIPERAVRPVAPLEVSDRTGWPPDRARPLRLLARPESIQAMALLPDHPPVQFLWQGRAHRVLRVQGPERIAPEWWLDERPAATATRDYFILEDSAGQRFWVYREGLYPPPTGTIPRWYLHGFFA